MNEQKKRCIHLFSSVGGNCPAERKHFPRPANKQAEQRELESTRLMILGPGVPHRHDEPCRAMRLLFLFPFHGCERASWHWHWQRASPPAASRPLPLRPRRATLMWRSLSRTRPIPSTTGDRSSTSRGGDHESSGPGPRWWLPKPTVCLGGDRCGCGVAWNPFVFHGSFRISLRISVSDRSIGLSLSLSFPEQVTRMMTCPEHSGHHFWACPISSSCAKASILAYSSIYSGTRLWSLIIILYGVDRLIISLRSGGTFPSRSSLCLRPPALLSTARCGGHNTRTASEGPWWWLMAAYLRPRRLPPPCHPTLAGACGRVCPCLPRWALAFCSHDGLTPPYVVGSS